MTDPTVKPKLFKPKRAETPKFNGRSAIDSLYKTSHWLSYREEFLSYNPHCYACAAPSQVVDHLTPHKGDFKLFWQEQNFIPLCSRCHNTVTSLFDRHYRPGNSIRDKLGWFVWARARNEIKNKVKVVPFSKETQKWILEEKEKLVKPEIKPTSGPRI